MSDEQARKVITKIIDIALNKGSIDISLLPDAFLYTWSDGKIDLDKLYKAGMDKKLLSTTPMIREKFNEIEKVLQGLIRTQRMR